uniref:CB1 cannabinoid receptor-interacting protein 1 n=1 Tax=Chrysemys picta bellii TaxID=8478 RepID=A0A8C3F166_CHRPI
MGEIPKLVKINVSLKIQPNDGPVYFKVDGQRFDQNRTIKFLTGAKYTVEVVLKPGVVHATAGFPLSSPPLLGGPCVWVGASLPGCNLSILPL